MAAVGLVVVDDAAPTAGDTALQSILTGAGHTVTLIADEDPPPGGVDCYVISESGSPNVWSGYDTLAVPIVCLEVGGWDNLRMSTVNGTSGGSNANYNLDPHEITAGLPDPCQVRTSGAGQFGVADTTLPAGAEIFARQNSTATHIVGFAVDTGADLLTGTAPARRVALGYIDSWPPLLTANGQTLLLNAVDWALDAGVEVHEGSVDLSGAGALAVAGSPQPNGSATLAGNGTLATTGAPTIGADAELDGAGTLAAAGAATTAGDVELPGAGALAGGGTPVPSGVESLGGAGALSLAGSPVFAGSVQLNGAGLLSASGGPALHAIDLTVIVGPTRVGLASAALARAGTATSGPSRSGTATGAASRAGLATLTVSRSGTATADPTRTGTATAGPTRQGVTAGPTRNDRGG